MPTILLFFNALLAGAVLPMQAGVNAILARSTGHPTMAALVSFAVGTACLLAFVLVIRVPLGGLAILPSLPPWLWFSGGALGAFYVASMVFLAPKLGATAMVATVVAGQMLVSVTLDHFGLIGYAEHGINVWRLLGIVLIFSGVLLIQKF